MANYMLYVGSHGMEDPYRAALLFAAATAARDKGYEAKVALLGDGVLLMKEAISKHAKPQGRPGSLHDMIQDAVKAKVTIHC